MILCVGGFGCKKAPPAFNFVETSRDEVALLDSISDTIDLLDREEAHGVLSKTPALERLLTKTESSPIPDKYDPESWREWVNAFTSSVQEDVMPRVEWLDSIEAAKFLEFGALNWGSAGRSQYSDFGTKAELSKQLTFTENRFRGQRGSANHHTGIYADFSYAISNADKPIALNRPHIREPDLLGFFYNFGLGTDYRLTSAGVTTSLSGDVVTVEAKLSLPTESLRGIPFRLEIERGDSRVSLEEKIAETLEGSVREAFLAQGSVNGIPARLVEGEEEGALTGEIDLSDDVTLDIRVDIGSDGLPVVHARPTARQLAGLMSIVAQEAGVDALAENWTLRNLRPVRATPDAPAVLVGDGLVQLPDGEDQSFSWNLKRNGVVECDASEDLIAVANETARSLNSHPPSEIVLSEELVNTALKKLFPKMADLLSCVEVRSSSYRLGLEIPNYPPLVLTGHVATSELIEQSLRRECSSAGIIEAAKVQWPESTIHPLFGEILVGVDSVDLAAGNVALGCDLSFPGRDDSLTPAPSLPIREVFDRSRSWVPARTLRGIGAQEAGKIFEKMIQREFTSDLSVVNVTLKSDGEALQTYLATGRARMKTDVYIDIPGFPDFTVIAKDMEFSGNGIKISEKVKFRVSKGVAKVGPIAFVDPAIDVDFGRGSAGVSVKITPALGANLKLPLGEYWGDLNPWKKICYIEILGDVRGEDPRLRGYDGVIPLPPIAPENLHTVIGAEGRLVILERFELAGIRAELNFDTGEFMIYVRTAENVPWGFPSLEARASFSPGGALVLEGHTQILGFEIAGATSIRPVNTDSTVTFDGKVTLFGAIEASVSGASDIGFKNPRLHIDFTIPDFKLGRKSGVLTARIIAKKEEQIYVGTWRSGSLEYQFRIPVERNQRLTRGQLSSRIHKQLGLTEGGAGNHLATGQHASAGDPSREIEVLYDKDPHFAVIEDVSDRSQIARVPKSVFTKEVARLPTPLWRGSRNTLAMVGRSLEKVVLFPDVVGRPTVVRDLSTIFSPLRHSSLPGSKKNEALKVVLGEIADGHEVDPVHMFGDSFLITRSGDRSDQSIFVFWIGDTRYQIRLSDAVSLQLEDLKVRDLLRHHAPRLRKSEIVILADAAHQLVVGIPPASARISEGISISTTRLGTILMPVTVADGKEEANALSTTASLFASFIGRCYTPDGVFDSKRGDFGYGEEGVFFISPRGIALMPRSPAGAERARTLTRSQFESPLDDLVALVPNELHDVEGRLLYLDEEVERKRYVESVIAKAWRDYPELEWKANPMGLMERWSHRFED